MLKPAHLLALTVVVRTRSFTEAGRELGYTASAVGQQIAALERDLGLRLVDREPQRIRPTAAAHRLADRSRHVLDLLAALEQEAGALASGQAGRLTVATALDPGTTLVAAALSTLRASRSRLDIRLERTGADRLLERVDAGSVEVGLLYDFPAAPRAMPDGVRAHLLVEEPWQLVTPARAPHRPASLGDLAGQDLVVGLGSGGLDAWAAVSAVLGLRLRSRTTVDNADLAIGLVAAGHGVGVVPTSPWPAPETVTLTPLARPGASRRTVVVHRGGPVNTAVVAAVRALRVRARVERERGSG